jgi:hypothetical protein
VLGVLLNKVPWEVGGQAGDGWIQAMVQARGTRESERRVLKREVTWAYLSHV